MKVFYNRKFVGHYPVPTAAVAVAESAEIAADMLQRSLRGTGLGPRVEAYDMIEIELQPQVIVLNDGNF